jgi:hypothetical protein
MPTEEDIIKQYGGTLSPQSEEDLIKQYGGTVSVLDDPRNIYLYTTPEGGAVYGRPPGIPPVPVPVELQTDRQRQRAEWDPFDVNARTGLPYRQAPMGSVPFLDYLYSGPKQMLEGGMRIGGAQSGEDVAGGASDIIRGGMTTATPLVSSGLIRAPLATVAGLGLFTGTQYAIERSAKAFGLPEGYARLAGDIAGIWGGGRTYQWLGGLGRAAATPEANAIYQQLEGIVGALKDPNMQPWQRNQLRAQAEGLLDGLRTAEARTLLPPMFPNPNQAEREAYQYMRQDVGAAPSAGAASGSPFVRGAQHVTGMTPVGAIMDVRAKGRTVEALRARAGQLVAGATPEEGSPEDLYGDFRQYEASSKPVEVPVGMARDGSIVRDNLKMPVDVRDLKNDLQPIYDEMQWMPASDRSSSAGYTAIERILNGPDHIPASQAEIGLGGIKKMAREGEGRNAGIAKYITPKLQDLIDGTVRKNGGDDAVTSLQKARVAAAKQAGADWLTEQFGKAQAAGGFNREAGLWAAWTNLKPEAKRTMFNQDQVRELDKFFLGTKMLAENPNPSGSALVGSLAAQGAYALGGGLLNPLFYLGQLGSAGMSKLLRSDAGIKLLTEGMKVPRNSMRGRFIERQLRDILGNPPPGTPPSGGTP